MAIRKRQGKSGIAYQVYWNNPYTGARESKTLHSLAEARAFDSLTKHKLEYETEAFRPEDDIRHGQERTVEDAVFLYLREKKFTDHETATFLSSLRQVFARIGHYKLQEVSSDAFDLLKRNLLSMPKQRGDGLVSQAYVRGILSNLRTVLRWAKERGMLDNLPTMKVPSPNYARTIPPTIEETSLIISVSPPHLQRVIVLGAALGLRVGKSELLSLTWDKIDLGLGCVRIDTSRKNPNAPWREIPIREDLLPLFRQWKEEDTVSGLAHLVTYAGKPVTSIKKAWLTALSKAGITRRVRPYDLRHTFATQLIAAGNDPGTVAELLGHSSPQMVYRHYQHVLTSQKRRAVESSPSILMCQGHVPKEKALTK